MNGIQSTKSQNINVDKHVVGCLGRMVNLFDLSTGIPGNRLLTDKPHRDGAMLSRSQSDVARIVTSPHADQIEDKPVVSELRRNPSNKNTNGTPMKTLIAQEMSKEVESKHNRPNVVAKLMGLDTLPPLQSRSAAQRSHSKGYSRHSLSHSSIPVDCWEQDRVFLDNRTQSEVNKCQEQNECKDVYEIWQQSQRTSYSRDGSMQKGRCNENISEAKMALVRQKFMEAKRLATDEKLRQSKEFQDALEVLSTNRDLLLRFLQEPNSLFSQQLYDLQTTPPPETKRITVLRPSKVVDDKYEGSGEKSDNKAKNPTQMIQETGWERNSPVYSPVCSNQKVNENPAQSTRIVENPAQSTRIVVLKPSPGKTHNIKAVVSPPSSPSRISHGEDIFEEPEEDEVQESREVAKEITRQMHENLMGHRRDETLLSSVFSNGYVGDESSFNKSEIEYAVENLSDSEAMSPTSRHSWDYINRFGSPYSSSSFSRASCSPESSVCREAKKRLSERWAMMALNGNSQEQRHVRRSSSTLGEMLALSDTRKLMKSEDEGINMEQEPRGSTSCFTSNLNKEEGLGDSPRSLVRSKSVPASSTASGARLNVDVSEPETGKAQVPKELTSTKSSKSSLKGKVSSLFFSRTKKSSKEKCTASQSVDGCQPVTADAPGSVGYLHGMVSANASQSVNSGGRGECLSPGLRRPASLTSCPHLTGRSKKQGTISREVDLSVAKPVNVSENQDQPSPISVLEPPFEEDDNTFPESSGNFKLERPGTEVNFKSNLIDKSPPIESMARTLSWDDSCAETVSLYPLKSSSVSPGAEEEQDWLLLVQTLIQSAGLDGRVQSDIFFTRWHSPESPLDPSLRDKYTGNEKEPLHEAKRRQRRSNRKLVFDCVNAALVEITGYGSESDRSMRAMSCSGAQDMHLEGELPMLVDHVWARMKEWFSGEAGWFWVDGGDSNGLADSPPISLDDQDVQIALKLSDDLHLNEVDCVRLLVSANQECGLMGRDAIEILRLASGLWYTERRDLITALYVLFRAVVLDQGLEEDIVVDIQKYLEDLVNTGLRQRLISLIKELNREEPAGLGGPLCERYVLDSRGALVERRAVVYRERLILGHCLVLSVLVVRTSPKDVKDAFSALKDSAAELSENNDTLKHQITFSLLFSLVIAFISDALSTVPDKSSVLSRDASFRKEFHEIVMATGSDPIVEGFVGGVRLAWAVHLMLIHDEIAARETVSSSSSSELSNIRSCLETIFSNNVFQFLLDKVLRTAAYQNDDEDMVYMNNAYLHKLITCFLSHQLARDKVKESKDKAMSVLNSYRIAGSHDFVHDSNLPSQQDTEIGSLPFVSLLEFVSEIYQKEPELLSGNDVLWTFVVFAGEDHTNFQTLVAFLKMLSTLASSQEGASKVYELLQGKAFRSIGWRTLFDCLSIYDEKFKQSLQTGGALLPDFQEGDAKALVAYLNVLQKVMENGNPIERKNWFPEIEPLFKLLSYENVPPYLKGALRNAIAAFIHVSPVMKDNIWRLLEQYDLPVVVGTHVGNTAQPIAGQVYDMQFELNEIEARREQYPSTISFLNLLNALIAEEKDVSDRGRRFVGIFRFVYDHVFGPFPQRAYADPCEKWQLVVACLKHFHMILDMYDIQEEDIDNAVEQSSTLTQSSPIQMQLPVLELLKDFMSGKAVFRNIMGILQPGVDSIITERTSQIYGPLLEKAVQLSLEIVILVFEKDLLLSDFWRPLYQPVDVILSQDHNQIVALLEYVRYDFLPQIQQCSIKIMSILSSRMVGLVQLLLKYNAASSLVEDYAACLELRSEESQIIEKSGDDHGVLIMQLLIDNISRPAPNITHLLLKFDLDTPIERTVLQPKFHYSCLKIILEILEKVSKPDVNALLHEFGFQLLYELCLDPLTCGPTMDLLSNKKYQFFVKHLDAIGVAPLPKRNSNQALRISSLHQRAWLLKLLAVELHAGYGSSSTHQEACQTILAHLFGRDHIEETDRTLSLPFMVQNITEHAGTRTISKSKVLELLQVVQFRSPDTAMKLSQIVSNMKYDLLAEEILGNPTTSGKGGIYYYSERGDRLIDLSSFSDKLWKKFNIVYPQLSNFGSEAELNDVKEAIQQLLRWGWKYNKNLEEQAAQLHMLTGWSQVVEVSVSRRISALGNRSEILYQILDACLGASASPDCSLRMAFILCQVALTCMAKLRDEKFLCPGGLNSDSVTFLDVIMVKQLSNGACHSLLFKLIMAILRNESSEALRRRQYALLLSYFQYCQHMLAPDVPTTVLQYLLLDEQDGEDLDLQKIDKEQAELTHANFSTLRKEAQAILDLVIKDATQGSEPGKTISLYVLDVLICIDHEKYFLNQLQSRGFLRSCLMNVSNVSYQDGKRSLDTLQRACTLEAELALLLRISHNYGKSGAQVLFSMGALEHIASCRAMGLQGSLRRVATKPRRALGGDIDRQRMIITPMLRLVFSLTSLVDTSDFFEVKNKVVREVMDFIKGHQLLVDQVLQENISEADELTMEQINLVVGILGKVWPYEESDEHGFVQGLFGMMSSLFSSDLENLTFSQSARSLENQRKSELKKFQLCFSLSSYLYFMVTKKSLRLQVSGSLDDYNTNSGLQQLTLTSLSSLLNSATAVLERAAEEKSLLLNKIRDINELSRQEVDEVINMCVREDYVSSSDNIQKRRYVAMVEMCQVAGNRDQLITLLLLLTEHVLNVILIHFQDSSIVSDSSEAMRTITYGAKSDSGQDISLLCGKLIPILERLELLSEDKVGRDLKVFRRLVTSLKEMTIQKLAL